jgi:hypothetical protein
LCRCGRHSPEVLNIGTTEHDKAGAVETDRRVARVLAPRLAHFEIACPATRLA